MKILSLAFNLLLILGFAQGCSNEKNISSGEPISHEQWDKLVKKHVTEEGYVNYEGFIEDSVALNRYLNQLSNHHPNDSWSKNERLAYWLNAYNAFTVKLILDNWPVESIKDIAGGIPFVNTAWDVKFIEIEGEKYDLNNIEHGIIRKEFDEPRIHFAVNCASVSCPKLRNEAYTSEELDSQLDDQARDFINGPKNEIKENEVRLSRLFKWYGGDFTKKMGLKEFVNQYAEQKIGNEVEVEFKEYDWRLNIKENYR
ncbi:DUF547 domain-containing protein [Halocola ammonii]